MIRVTTLYASTAAATAGYYTQYLTQAVGEEPGQWTGRQAERFGLTGTVEAEQLERLLSGQHPTTGATLGHPLLDRHRADGTLVRAVSGFDATVSAPKSLSTWWALTGDQRLLDAHDTAVRSVVDLLERYGATTRIRSNSGRLHPDTEGLTIGAFRQSTSRLDDPQIHTHLVISAKVQVDDGRWFALDARMLKKHQRTLGGVYQSVLRAELTERLGVRFGEIVNGQAEIVGVPTELLDAFSKRAAQVDAALAGKLADFHEREQRDPTAFERAAMQREAAVDTRQHKTGAAVNDLRSRWLNEAAELGITPARLTRGIAVAGRTVEPVQQMATGDVITELSQRSSTWHRMDVIRTLTDQLRPRLGIDGQRWAAFLQRAADEVIGHSINLDPTADTRQRTSDGRSVWVEPIAAHLTSDHVLAQEERILTWAMDHHTPTPEPSSTVDTDRLDPQQADAAAAVAGNDPFVIVVGPAGTGKTTMLRAAVDDLRFNDQPVFAVAPTAKAARVLADGTGVRADTVAKLLHEWAQPDRPPGGQWRLPPGTRLIVDEAGLLATNDLDRLTQLVDSQGWRLRLVGDPMQLQAVERGGMFDELCRTNPAHNLEQIHRFTNRWEADASLALRSGDPASIHTYAAHGRIIPGRIDQHATAIANRWLTAHHHGQTVAVTTTANQHVDLLNRAIQHARLDAGHLDQHATATTTTGVTVYVGDVIATRRNDRRLIASDGDIVRNREVWTVTSINYHGDLTATRHASTATVTLPAAYVAEHVHLGYAATEPGNQSDTRTISANLITPATTGRGLYVAMTRARDENTAYVVTPEPTVDAARAVLEQVIDSDRTDTPAIVQRRELAAQLPPIVRVPELRPRCTVPDWWHTLWTQTNAAFDQVGAELTDLAAKQEARRDQIDAARTEATTASSALAPFERELDAADRQLTIAKQELADATTNAADHKVFGRRPAQERLAAAVDAVETATVRHGAAVEARQPYRHAGYHAARRLNEIIESDRLQTALEARHQLPERHQGLDAQIDALHNWRHWANGHDIPADLATWTVDTLEAVDDPHHTALADAITTRAPELIVHPDPEHTYGYHHERDLDFGIDL